MKGSDDEKVLDIARTEIRAARGGARCGAELRRHELVELADAGLVRGECDRLLGSDGPPGPEQDPVRRLPRPVRRLGPLAPPHDGALGPDVARGAREIPRS